MIAIAKFLRRQREATSEVLNALDTIRDQITVLIDEREVVENWPAPYSEAVKSLEGWLDSIGGMSVVPVGGFSSGLAKDWPRVSESAAGLMAMGLLIASARDKVRDVLASELRDYYEGRACGTAADQARRLREIDAELLVLERQEEKIVREAEAAGIPILRRENANPEIVLLADDRV